MVGDQQHLMPDAYPSFMLPKTPQRTTPNSSRKRLYTPNLIRTTASPSHCTKMSALFEDAASSLQTFTSPGPNRPSNLETPRMVSFQNRIKKFGQANCDGSAVLPSYELGYTRDDNHVSVKQDGEDSQPVNYPTLPSTPSRSKLIKSDRLMADSANRPLYTTNANPVKNITPLQRLSRFQPNSPAREPVSSGFVTPAYSKFANPETPGKFLDPGVGPSRVPQQPMDLDHSESDDEEHSSHGVRLVLSYTYAQAEAAQQANIDKWLEKVLRDSSKGIDPNNQSSHNDTDAKATQQDSIMLDEDRLQGFSSDSGFDSATEYAISSYQSSNKENIPPALPPRTPPPPYKSSSLLPTSTTHSPTAKRPTLPRPPSSTRKFIHPPTPGRHLSTPPRRKRLRTASDSPDSDAPFTSAPPPTPQDNTIRDESLAAALATLSPCVERHRKGQGPKRERCASFWDADVLEPGSPAYPTQRVSAANGW